MTTLVLSIFNGSSSFLQIRRTAVKACMSLNFLKIPSPIMELAPLEHLKKLMNSVVTTLAPSFLIGYLVTRKTIFTWISLNFKENLPQNVKLTAFECHKTLHRLTMGDLL